ncbi:hypothetical protein ACNKW1_01970 [Thauera sp. WH-2]|uniref:hypothetical protein n=1 Tax=Thauera sp. WH-2 TaxID=3401574 RepID=UPI003AAD5DB6
MSDTLEVPRKIDLRPLVRLLSACLLAVFMAGPAAFAEEAVGVGSVGANPAGTQAGDASLEALVRSGKLTVRAVAAFGRIPTRLLASLSGLGAGGVDVLGATPEALARMLEDPALVLDARQRAALEEALVILQQVQEEAGAGAGAGASPAAAALAPASVQAEPLFKGEMTEAWQPHAVRGGDFDAFARMEGGALRVAVASPSGAMTTGLKTAAPVVKLPQAGGDQVVRLGFDFDVETVRNVVFALVPGDQLGKWDWSVHEIWLAVEQTADGAPHLVLAVQRQVQTRLKLDDPGVLAGLTLELRPDGLILVGNGEGRVLIEGRMANAPVATDLHLQVSASSPDARAPARLDLRTVRLDTVRFVPNDPGVLLEDVPLTVTLFDGRTMAPHFQRHGLPRGGIAPEKLSIRDGLRVASEKGDGKNLLGIYAPEPVVWLDRFGPGASVRLRFEFDAAETRGFRLGLATPHSLSDGGPNPPRFVLDWVRAPDGVIRASRWLDREEARLDATPAAMPAVVELELTPQGVRVIAEGFPTDLAPWGDARTGQGLRLFILALADDRAHPVSMVLKRISMTRTPGQKPAQPLPAPGVEPLPVTRLFPDAGAPWEPFGLAGVDFAKFGHLDPEKGLTVAVERGFSGGRAGILSPAPVARLDQRILRTPYRLVLRFDPAATDGAQVMLSPHRVADMQKGSLLALSLVRTAEGRDAGSYVLTLTRDYYAYWSRRIPAEVMARWDGMLTIDLSPGSVVADLPGVTTMRGTGFIGIAKGAELSMAIQSRSDAGNGPVRMALRQVDAQWVTPDGMTALERMELVDLQDFDPEAYLDVLIDAQEK